MDETDIGNTGMYLSTTWQFCTTVCCYHSWDPVKNPGSVFFLFCLSTVRGPCYQSRLDPNLSHVNPVCLLEASVSRTQG